MNAAGGETMDYRGISRDADQVEFAGRQWVIALHTSATSRVRLARKVARCRLLVSRAGRT
jgi:hypothetical protein